MAPTPRWLLPCMTALAACTSVLGIEQLPPGTPQDAATDAPAFAYAVAECQNCTERSCAEQATACLASPGCVALYQCLVQCLRDDAPCRAACEEGHPAGVADTAAVELDACRRGSCLDQCLGTGGLIGPWGSATCESCMKNQCDDSLRACAQDARCERAILCLGGCENPKCGFDCLYAHYGEPVDVMQPTVSCLATACYAECEIGERWNCTGEFSWGVSRSPGPLTWETAWFEAPPRTPAVPLSGLQVDVCEQAEAADCVVYWSTTTDALGQATLQLPLIYGRFNGHFRALGQAGFVQRFYVGRPVTYSEVPVGLSIFPSAEVASVTAALVFGQPLDPALGFIAGRVVDCTGMSAPGITVTVDDAGVVPDQTVVAYAGTPSTGEGSGVYGVINAAPGKRKVTAWREGVDVGSAEVWVDAGGGAFTNIYPRGD
jgi:hypothetical protein